MKEEIREIIRLFCGWDESEDISLYGLDTELYATYASAEQDVKEIVEKIVKKALKEQEENHKAELQKQRERIVKWLEDNTNDFDDLCDCPYGDYIYEPEHTEECKSVLFRRKFWENYPKEPKSRGE